MDNRCGAARPLTLMLTLVALLLTSTGLASTAAQPATAAATELAAIKPEMRGDIGAAMPTGLPAYELTLAFPPAESAERSLSGTATVTYTNTTGATLETLPFRLYANGPDEGNDAIRIDTARVNETDVRPELSVNNSVVTIPLPAPLEPDGQTTVSLRFTADVPVDDRTHYGILNYATEPGTWALAHWYPILAGRDASGWVLDPPSVNGDPVFSNTGLYEVTITAPEELTLITSGIETRRETAADGMQVVTYEAAPSRDFVLVADTDMRATTREVEGTTVTSWYEPGNEAAGEAAAEWSARSLAMFNELLGEYPYRRLEVVQAPIYGAVGVEFPQLFTLDDEYYGSDPTRSTPSSFEFTVAHEVVHQWFYNLVGNNQYAHAFTDEGLTNYLAAEVYFGRVYDQEVGRRVRQTYLESPYESALAAGRDQIVNTPTDAFPSSGGYVMAAYSKAPLGFAAIHEAIGDEAFFAGLRAYAETYRFRVAEPEDLLTALEEASGQDLSGLWTRWFERKQGG